MTRLEKAFSLFDAYNSEDPNVVMWEGKEYPAETFYALQLHHWVHQLKPDAGEALLLASRCQHIGRWKIPREHYLNTKAGYLNWRADLAKFHAATACKLLEQAGYDAGEIQHVQHILLKENLKLDDEVQVMENALCLVFLQFQYEDFLMKHDEEKVIRILRKSWKKMSDPGRDAALQLHYSEKGKDLVMKALAV
jgi:hypothetical protein